MTIQYKTLWKTAATLILGAMAAFAYVRYFAKPGPEPAALFAAGGTSAESGNQPPPEFARLSVLIDGYIDAVFSPLEAGMPPTPQHELRMLREHFADSVGKVSGRAQPMYQTAIQLTDALFAAIKERETSAASLSDMRSKAYGVALSQDKKKAEEERRKFFESNVLRRWADSSRSLRDGVVKLYTRLRQQEREFSVGGLPSAPGEPGTMIVLQHPATVRLRYGSATLPAGLSLRVVDRTASGIVVEYGGERITLPPQ